MKGNKYEIHMCYASQKQQLEIFQNDKQAWIPNTAYRKDIQHINEWCAELENTG